MARVTVEDCLDYVDNRFQLVLLAAKRARQLERGSEPFLDWENDKPTVMALREVAEGKIGRELLEQSADEEFAVRVPSQFPDLEELAMPEPIAPAAQDPGSGKPDDRAPD